MNVGFGPLTEEFYPWLKNVLDPIICDDTNGVIAYNMDTDDILAVSVMDSWTINSCQMHVAIFNPLAIRHGFLRETFDYVFITCGRKMAFGLTPADKEKAIKFNTHIGFKEIARLPDAYDDGVDYIIYQMNKEDCRWLSPAKLEKVA